MGLALGVTATACQGGASSSASDSEGSTSVTGVTSVSTDASSTGAPTSTSSSSGVPTTTEGVEGSGTDSHGTTTGTSADTSTGEPDTSGTSGTTVEDTTTGELCEAPGLLLVCDDKSDDPWHVLGLGCEGALENTIPILNPKFQSKVVAYRAAKGFGTAFDPNAPGSLLFRPHEGEKFLVISTGQIAALQPNGALVEVTPQFENANNFNPDAPEALPLPMSPLRGSNGGQGGTPFQGCDGVNDCSDSIDPNWVLGNQNPNDLLFGSFEVTVPPGTHGFGFDVAYFSSEYPDYVGEQFNDMFIGWVSSESYTGNVTFLDGQPFTVTALAGEMEKTGFIGADPALAGTGFEGGGSTGWVTINWKVSPGETFAFAIAIMDMGDSSKATLALLDNWRWSCKGCVLIEEDPLCGTDGHPKCCGLCVEEIDDPKCGTEGHPNCCTAG
ncbi:MAG: choice-of-anchor L domain-containing protein [Nannocystis sp.]|nr:choice-of-anchor L domain-containing protein [Nannocystis sp.]MBA3550055.1 choice-of-anchor L domain-containing protein [Nannocystis sp.]